MKRLDRYMLTISLPLFLGALLLLAVAVQLSGVIPSFRWLEGKTIDLVQLAAWLGLQLPAYMIQVAPIALVLTVLLVIGRLISNQEFVAIAMSGVSPLRYLSSLLVLAMGVLFSALLANQYVLPATSEIVSSSWWMLNTDSRGLWRLEGLDLPIGRHRLSFASSEDDSRLSGVRLVSWDGRQATVIRAPRGVFVGNELTLEDATLSRLDFGVLSDESDHEPDLNELATYEKIGSVTVPLDRTVDQLMTQFSGGSYEDGRSLSDLSEDAANIHRSHAERLHSEILLNRKVAEPTANLVMVLMALPLALMYVRTPALAFGLSIVVALSWFLLLSFGMNLAYLELLPPWQGVWLGNAVLTVVGLILLWRMKNR